jgi:hypothetical protein
MYKMSVSSGKNYKITTDIKDSPINKVVLYFVWGTAALLGYCTAVPWKATNVLASYSNLSFMKHNYRDCSSLSPASLTIKHKGVQQPACCASETASWSGMWTHNSLLLHYKLFLLSLVSQLEFTLFQCHIMTLMFSGLLKHSSKWFEEFINRLHYRITIWHLRFTW